MRASRRTPCSSPWARFPRRLGSKGSGLDVDQEGLRCDPSLTAAAGVVAAGDLVRWRHPVVGECLRIEHRTNAAEQGEHAAKSLLAGEGPRAAFAPVPYVWSDQYDLKIQMIGAPRPDDETVVVDGSLDELSFLVLYGRGGRLTAALGLRRSRALMAYRPLLEQGASFAAGLVSYAVVSRRPLRREPWAGCRPFTTASTKARVAASGSCKP